MVLSITIYTGARPETQAEVARTLYPPSDALMTSPPPPLLASKERNLICFLVVCLQPFASLLLWEYAKLIPTTRLCCVDKAQFHLHGCMCISDLCIKMSPPQRSLFLNFYLQSLATCLMQCISISQALFSAQRTP